MSIYKKFILDEKEVGLTIDSIRFLLSDIKVREVYPDKTEKLIALRSKLQESLK